MLATMQNEPSSLRVTQRAPRSCKSCTSRKIKCDKSVPCFACVKRGQAHSCLRETVVVRGQVTTATDTATQTSYQDLLQENYRLRQALAAGKSTQNPQQLTAKSSDLLETSSRHSDLFQLDNHNQAWMLRPSQEAHMSSEPIDLHDIMLPSRDCSDGLVAYDKNWNSWAHYAIEYPLFEFQHAQFMDSVEAGVALSDMDPSWLSIYFSLITASLLTMDDDEVQLLGLPSVDHQYLQRHWYDAALFFLYRADFLRQLRLEHVQAAAILQMSFSTFGDYDLNSTIHACAMTTARSIGLDRESPMDETKLTTMSKEGRRRLWWTLVICEWLSGPHPPSQLTENDFDVALPTAIASRSQSELNEIDPAQYHLYLAKASTIYNRFRQSLRHNPHVPPSESVRKADAELAQLIAVLPDHLSPDGIKRDEEEERLRERHPWLRWQRVSMTLVLLFHRLRINKILQRDWQAHPEQYGWARNICLGAAKGLIWISENWEQSAAKRSQWALAWNIYQAAVFLISEATEQSPASEEPEIHRSIQILDSMRARNRMAGRASELLQQLLQDT